MKTIIAGSRDINEFDTVKEAIEESKFKITEIVSGGCRGVDWLGECYGNENEISTKSFPADWKQHGKAAGPIRNREMAEYADALIAVWDGQSKGTANMIQEAKEKGLKVFVHNV